MTTQPKFCPFNHSPLPLSLILACRSHAIRPTRHLLWARLKSQTLDDWVRPPRHPGRNPFAGYQLRKRYRMSSSRFGIGQKQNSHCTPLGLHRIAEKIGGGHPVGTAFQSRRPVGYVWQGMPEAGIAHCILWLEGLEPGHNQGADVDSYTRYIYIHGVGDELTLGKPASRGCLHLAASDILPLYYRVPRGTLVWIEDRD